MQKLEKHTTPRQLLQLLIRFRPVEAGSGEPEIATETFNISRSAPAPM